MYTAPGTRLSDLPSNTNSRDEALLCVTDLEDCCGTRTLGFIILAMRTMHGNWYFPDGKRVGFGGYAAAFQVNRGPNEVILGRTFYGSVRLYRRYSNPPERGRFRCELPSAANPNVSQILYANICEFFNKGNRLG